MKMGKRQKKKKQVEQDKLQIERMKIILFIIEINKLINSNYK